MGSRFSKSPPVNGKLAAMFSKIQNADFSAVRLESTVDRGSPASARFGVESAAVEKVSLKDFRGKKTTGFQNRATSVLNDKKMKMNHIRRGAGKPLLLIHGIGGSRHSWQTIFEDLASEREVIAVDLPGHGDTPALQGETTIDTMCDAVAEFLDENDLTGVDAVGSSMGARMVLELARRGGVLGAVMSLDPGGFWQGWQIPYFYHSVNLSIKLIRALQPVMPQLTRNVVARSFLFAQFSARPWRIPPKVALDERRSFAASPVFDELLYNLAYGEEQKGAPKNSIKNPLIIGWGRRDRVTFPSQAKLALEKFPDAQIYRFDRCGHFPQWDQPHETVRLILDGTAGDYIAETDGVYDKATNARAGNCAFSIKTKNK